jgi:hypothetical protein
MPVAAKHKLSTAQPGRALRILRSFVRLELGQTDGPQILIPRPATDRDAAQMIASTLFKQFQRHPD